MNSEEIIKNILTFLKDENKINQQDLINIKPNTDLIEYGIIDSMGVLELLVYIEKEFSIDLEKSVINAENMRSLSAICDFIITQINEEK